MKIMVDEKKKKPVPGRLKMYGVRLSYPHLWTPQKFKRVNKQTGEIEYDLKFTANFLFPQDGGGLEGEIEGVRMPLLKALKTAKLAAIAAKIGDDKASRQKIKPGNYAVKDGDDEDYDGYAGMYYLSASNSKIPKAKAKDARALKESDGVLFAGCYVMAMVTLWFQQSGEHKDGGMLSNAVHGSLEGVQFLKKGEAFGTARVQDSDFEDLTDDSDEMDEDDDDDDNDNDNDML